MERHKAETPAARLAGPIMYHEESVLQGVLHWRSTPDGLWIAYNDRQLTERLVAVERELTNLQAENEPNTQTPENDSDLRAAILNLPCDHTDATNFMSLQNAMRAGHKQARSAAAELVLPLVERCRELETLLREIDDAGYIKTKHTANETGLEERVAAFLAKIEKGEQ